MFFHCLCKYWDFHLGFGFWLHSHGDISGTVTSTDNLAWHLARSGKGYIGYTVCILAELAYEGEIPKGSVHIWSLKN